MTILVTGSTGNVGYQVLSHLLGRNVAIRALTRSPDKLASVPGITPVRGDLADPDSMRAALDGVSTLFLLAPNVADELTQSMQALSLARDANVKGIVYLSVFKSAAFADVPHFAAKRAVERMIEAMDLPATVLRPAYFIQNDLRQKESLIKFGAYSAPIGPKGVSMVDIRDIGDAAAIELMRRESASSSLGPDTYELVGPDGLTGDAIASIWSNALGRTIRYGGDDLDATEQRLKSMLPTWHALDLRLMFSRYQRDGAIATAEELGHLTDLLGRAPRSYRDFARDAATQWAST